MPELRAPPEQARGKLFRLGFRQPGGQAALFPESTSFDELDALSALQNATLGADGTGRLEAARLGHGGKKVLGGGLKKGAENNRDLRGCKAFVHARQGRGG